MATTSTPSPELARLRALIEKEDREIIRRVVARVDLAGRAIRVRSTRSGTVYDPAQEARVLERARRWAEEWGLDPLVAEDLMRLIVNAGKARARREGAAPCLATTRTSAVVSPVG